MDARIERTRRSLQQALVELAREHPLDDITIGDITEHAGVNRSTFYQHYADKETLLADALESAAADAGAALPTIEEPLPEPPEALLSYLEHLDANAALYSSTLGERGSIVVASRLQARLGMIVRDGVIRSGATAFGGIPLDILSSGIAGSALGVIGAWLSMDPRPAPAVAAGWVWQIIAGPGGSWVPLAAENTGEGPDPRTGSAG